MIIAVDFDGTVVDHRFPEVGEDAPFAVDVLTELVVSGNKLILFTIRSGVYLDNAVRWFKDRGIELWGIQVNPEQSSWTTSPKAYAEVYIDDAAIGVPTVFPYGFSRPCVDWNEIKDILYSPPELGGLNERKKS